MGYSAVFLCYWRHDYMVQMKSRVWLQMKYNRFCADGLSVEVRHFFQDGTYLFLEGSVHGWMDGWMDELEGPMMQSNF